MATCWHMYSAQSATATKLWHRRMLISLFSFSFGQIFAIVEWTHLWEPDCHSVGDCSLKRDRNLVAQVFLSYDSYCVGIPSGHSQRHISAQLSTIQPVAISSQWLTLSSKFDNELKSRFYCNRSSRWSQLSGHNSHTRCVLSFHNREFLFCVLSRSHLGPNESKERGGRKYVRVVKLLILTVRF